MGMPRLTTKNLKKDSEFWKNKLQLWKRLFFVEMLVYYSKSDHRLDFIGLESRKIIFEELTIFKKRKKIFHTKLNKFFEDHPKDISDLCRADENFCKFFEKYRENSNYREFLYNSEIAPLHNSKTGSKSFPEINKKLLIAMILRYSEKQKNQLGWLHDFIRIEIPFILDETILEWRKHNILNLPALNINPDNKSWLSQLKINLKMDKNIKVSKLLPNEIIMTDLKVEFYDIVTALMDSDKYRNLNKN